MAVKDFEELIAWQKSQDLAVLVYKIFNKSKEFRFRDQICSASVSISSNIAEGFDKNSNLDFTRFLNIARGSCNEVKSLVYLAYRLGFIELKDRDRLIKDCAEISRIILGLIQSMKGKPSPFGKK